MTPIEARQSHKHIMQTNDSSLANIDFFKVFWDARWLLLLGTLLGLGGGYFHFSRTPSMYRSIAQIQIIDSLENSLPLEELQSGWSSKNLRDEVMVMRSEQNLRRAVELGELSSCDEFAGRSPEQIAAMLSRPNLSISPASRSVTTSIFNVQYESTSPQTTQLVVQSVVDAYAVHLQDQYHNVGQETVNLIQKARNEVLAKLNKLDTDFNAFKKHSGLIYRGSDTTSIHRDNADRYLAQKQELLIQKARMSGILNSAKKALKAKRPYEAILMAFDSAATFDDQRIQESAVASLSPAEKWELEKIKSKPIVSIAEQMRQNKLLPLELEREVLIDSVGQDHPAIEMINRRIAIITKTVNEVAANERRLNHELDEAMTAAAAVTAGTSQVVERDPQKNLFKRIRFAVGAMRQNMEAIDAELKLISNAYATEIRMAREETDGEIQSEQFVREIARHQQLYDRIVARLDEVSLLSGGDGLKVYPLNTAKMGAQYAPIMSRSLIVGGLLGCLMAVGLALLRKMSDRSYQSARDIAEHTGLPIIGHVPMLNAHVVAAGEPGKNLDSRLVTFFKSKGQKAEAFRAIRTAIYFSNQSGDNQILQITSATPSDGKTTIATNIAVAIAQSGRSVLLMDCDLRRPRIGKAMGIEQPQGTAWAIGQCTRERCSQDNASAELSIQEVISESEVPNLSVMIAGDRPDNPAELLSSSHFDRLLGVLRTKFDMIILDTPPLLAVSDPANIAPRVDGVMMVVRLRKNIKPAVAQATRMLETLEANVLGIIVNGVGSRAARGYGKGSNSEGGHNQGQSYRYGYGYTYGYSYTEDEHQEYYEDASS